MGVFKQAREAKKLQGEWENLYHGADAYRPDQPEARQAIADPSAAIQHLSDVANQVGLTAGDAGIIGVEVVRRVDRIRNPERAIIEIVDAVHSGQLRTVAGRPMKDFVGLAGAALVAATALAVARPEASIEYQQTDPNMARVRDYVESLEGPLSE